MDAGSTPPILRHHATDEIAKLGVGAWAAWLAGNAAPIGAIRSSVPRDDAGRFDDCERRGPLRPYGPQCDPEGAIDGHESRTTSAACDDGELLSQGEVVQDQGLPREGHGPNSPEDQLEREEHRGKMPAGSAIASDAAESIL